MNEGEKESKGRKFVVNLGVEQVACGRQLRGKAVAVQMGTVATEGWSG